MAEGGRITNLDDIGLRGGERDGDVGEILGEVLGTCVSFCVVGKGVWIIERN